MSSRPTSVATQRRFLFWKEGRQPAVNERSSGWEYIGLLRVLQVGIDGAVGMGNTDKMPSVQTAVLGNVRGCPGKVDLIGPSAMVPYPHSNHPHAIISHRPVISCAVGNQTLFTGDIPRTEVLHRTIAPVAPCDRGTELWTRASTVPARYIPYHEPFWQRHILRLASERCLLL